MESDEQLFLLRLERDEARELEEEAEPWANTPVAPQDVGAAEAAPGDAGSAGGASIEGALSLMQAEELRSVASRYAPAARPTRKGQMLAEVAATLRSPERLDAMIAGLGPRERDLLEELARRGGAVDGWELVTFAVLRGHRAEPDRVRRSAYGRALGRTNAAGYLGPSIVHGLLVPSDTDAAWFDFGYGGEGSDVVYADARLLARLPWGEVPPPERLALEPVEDAHPQARHPAATVLELFDVLQLVADEGGLNVTRRGTVAKPYLKRLANARPYLWERLDVLLRTLAALGLVRPPEDERTHRPWAVDAGAVAQLRRLPLFMLYAAFVDASCTVRHPAVDRAWTTSRGGTVDARAFWRAMLDSLETLPEHPVDVEGVAEALWERVLAPAFGRLPPPGLPPRVWDPPPEAIHEMLLAQLPRLGLLAAERKEAYEPAGVVAPSLGARWYARARALFRRHAHRDPEAAPGPEAAWPAADTPAESSLLVQANFEVLAYLDRLSTDALTALACASVERIDAHTARLRIDRSSVNRALDLGDDLQALLARLRTHAHDLPENVAATMHEWAAQRERLRVHVGARVLEYATEGERDAALPRITGGRALAERFVLLETDAPAPQVQQQHDYREAPARGLAIGTDAVVRTKGPLDLEGRAALHALTRPAGKGRRRLDPDAVRASGRAAQHKQALAARTLDGLPPQVDAMMRAWSGEAPRAVVASATLFRHPDAATWAQHPEVKPLLGAQLNPTTYLVAQGQEGALWERLETLGLTLDAHLEAGVAPGAHADAGAEEGALQTGLSTRKKRELMEAAIEAGDDLELRYAEERERYTAYGYPRRSRGKTRRERVTPDAVVYEGSIPYLIATSASRGSERVIRIGYVEAIAIAS